MCEGWEDLKGSKYDWLTNLGNLSRKRQRSFKLPRESTLKTARAWVIKHLAMHPWTDFTAPGREAAYEWIAAELRRFAYLRLGRAEKGCLRHYLCKGPNPLKLLLPGHKRQGIGLSDGWE